MKKLAQLFSVPTSQTRLEILHVLMNHCYMNQNKGLCVNEINKEIHLPKPYISKHLKILTKSGVLSYRREGHRVDYHFAEDSSLNTIFQYFKTCYHKYQNIESGVTT